MNEHGGWDNWKMLLIKYFPCHSKLELESEERKQIELLGATLNKHIPTRTKKEWYQDNKEQILEEKKEINKQHYQDNKETIAQKGKKYREQNKEKIKEKKKQYYEQNKEKIKEKQKEYYKQNEEKKKQAHEQNKEKELLSCK